MSAYNEEKIYLETTVCSACELTSLVDGTGSDYRPIFSTAIEIGSGWVDSTGNWKELDDVITRDYCSSPFHCRGTVYDIMCYN